MLWIQIQWIWIRTQFLELCYTSTFWKMLKIILMEIFFFLKKMFLLMIITKKIMPSEEFFSLLSLWMVNLSIWHLLPLIFLIFTCVDPDPYLDYGSGSTKLPNTVPIWIGIHNTGGNAKYFETVLWIKIHWIWIRIQDFGPIWIWIRNQVRIQGNTINFERKYSK